MSVIKCKMCGGDLELIEGSSVAVCEYCGSQQTVPAADNEKKLTLFARANRLRLACEFDKAAGVYESIVADFPTEAEAYWGLVLCRYGIEYVDDPATGKKIPTCHRSSFDSLMEDSDFEQALENADAVARRVYRDEAKAIEELRRGIVEVSGKEPPYDIFICYKETAEDGQRTVDSVIAQDVYDALTEKGYRVFFSRISLEDKLGTEYEPYIFAALHSAKIMLAFGTDYEYYNAVWVKNEWSRYLQLMTKDKSKHLIPCYKGIDAYDMPKEFAKLQAQDMGKVGAMQDLLRGVDKIIGKGAGAAPAPAAVNAPVNATVDSLLDRAWMFLEDEDYQKAHEYFERVLDIDPRNSRAYLGNVLATLQIPSLAAIDTKVIRLDTLKDFERAMRFASESERQELGKTYDSVQEKYLINCIYAILKNKLKKQLRKQQKNFNAKSLLALGEGNAIGLSRDGTVVSSAKCDTESWKHIVGVSNCGSVFCGLSYDGKIKITEGNKPECAHDIERWHDIVSIASCLRCTIGLRVDGTVVSCGKCFCGEDNVDTWHHITAIACGNFHTVGLRSDGTVVACGTNKDGVCDVAAWRKIVEIAACRAHTVGLSSNGTAMACGNNDHGECDVSEWQDIVSIACGSSHTVGLKSDGTAIATGDNSNGQCDVAAWQNLVAVVCGWRSTAGICADGTIVTCGLNEELKHIVEGWKIFDDIDSYPSLQTRKREYALLESKEAEEQRKVKTYEKAQRLAKIDTSQAQIEAAELFNKIVGWRDASEQAARCWQLAEELTAEETKNAIYEKAVQLATFGESNYQRKAAEEFALIPGWRDADEQVELCRQAAERLARQEEELTALKNKKRASLTSEKKTLQNELSNLKGLFTGKRRKEIESRLVEIEAELKKL